MKALGRGEAIVRTLTLLRVMCDGQWRVKRDLAKRFGVHPRTIYRDFEALSKAGLPVECDVDARDWPTGRYRLVNSDTARQMLKRHRIPPQEIAS